MDHIYTIKAWPLYYTLITNRLYEYLHESNIILQLSQTWNNLPSLETPPTPSSAPSYSSAILLRLKRYKQIHFIYNSQIRHHGNIGKRICTDIRYHVGVQRSESEISQEIYSRNHFWSGTLDTTHSDTRLVSELSVDWAMKVRKLKLRSLKGMSKVQVHFLMILQCCKRASECPCPALVASNAIMIEQPKNMK